MSVMRIETILCDAGEDCMVEPPFGALFERITREEAAKAGWTHPAPDVDYCPEHSASTPTETTSAG